MHNRKTDCSKPFSRSMKKVQLLAVVMLFAFLVMGARAQQQEEARAAWQVLRFDITASINPSAGAAERALTCRAVLSVRNVGQGTGRTFTVRLNPAAEFKTATVGSGAAPPATTA